jgi:hypothetical protein
MQSGERADPQSGVRRRSGIDRRVEEVGVDAGRCVSYKSPMKRPLLMLMLMLMLCGTIRRFNVPRCD